MNTFVVFMADRRHERRPREEPLRVAFFGPMLEGTVGGIAEHVRLLLAWMNSQPDVDAIAVRTGGKAYGEPWLLKIARVPARLVAVWRAARWADIVHVNTTIDRRSVLRDVVVAQVARFAGARIVIQCHGGSRVRLGRLGSAMSLAWLRPALAAAAAMLFLTPEQARELEDLAGGVPVLVVPNAVPIPQCAQRGNDAGPIVVLYLGRLDRDKGVVALVEAFEDLALPDCTLVVAGTGELDAWVAAAADRIEGVVFAGAVFGEEKSRALCEADVFVLASSHDEGMPYALLEAGAAGCALIATARGRITSIVHDQRNGIILSDASKETISAALRSVTSDRSALRAMGQESRRIVQDDFDIETVGPRMLGLYRRIVSGEVTPDWFES
jgi:glycosyltransferase involved in cell wall biosynthesis